jgi:hypothetical protein
MSQGQAGEKAFMGLPIHIVPSTHTEPWFMKQINPVADLLAVVYGGGDPAIEAAKALAGLPDDAENSASLSPFLVDILRDWMVSTMCDISEEHYAAGWMCGLEHEIWESIQRLPTRVDYGRVAFREIDLKRLRGVAEILGQWRTYTEFVPMQDWLPMHEVWKKERAAR